MENISLDVKEVPHFETLVHRNFLLIGFTREFSLQAENHPLRTFPISANRHVLSKRSLYYNSRYAADCALARKTLRRDKTCKVN